MFVVVTTLPTNIQNFRFTPAKYMNTTGVHSLPSGIANKKIAKKPRKKALNVLKDITNISVSLSNEKVATHEATDNVINEDHLSGDDDSDMDDYNIDDSGNTEVI